MIKGLIICLLTTITFSKRYIVTVKDNANVWMENSVVPNNEMKELNVKNTKMIFIDTEIKPEEWNDDNVLFYEEDKIIPPTQVGEVSKDGLSQSPHLACSQTWGLDRINEVDLPLDGVYLGDGVSELRGDDVDVYVLDTGINILHNVFPTPPTWLAHFGSDGVNDDCHGHGTHVGGTVGGTLTGVASSANLFSVKISSWCADGQYPGSAYCSDMIEAIEYVQDLMENNGRKTVISLSYGICSSVTTAINEFTSAGGLFALASGNDGEDQCTELEYSSLDKSGMFLVGATESDDDVSYFSNHGSCVDIYAPGSAILSADYLDINNCVSWYGTSMATPHVSGAMAVLWARNPSMTNTQIRTLLMNDALTNKLDFGSLYGNNKLLYLDNDVSPSPTPSPTPDDYSKEDGEDEVWYEIILNKYFWFIIIAIVGCFATFFGICITVVCQSCCCNQERFIVRDLQPGESIV